MPPRKSTGPDTIGADSKTLSLDSSTPMKAIRAKCIDCCAGQRSEVEQCGAVNCPLYPYRLGKSPNRKPRQLTDEQRKAVADRLAKARNSKTSK
jgi:hypothetical protein